MTEFRGKKANIHISKEVDELCSVINSEGYPLSEEEPDLKWISFGELFDVSQFKNVFIFGTLILKYWKL